MKYRIVVRDSTTYPYQVERGREQSTEIEYWEWFKRKLRIESTTMWYRAELCQSVADAQRFIQEDIARVKALGKEIIPGNVVFEYDEQDQVVDKLKGLR